MGADTKAAEAEADRSAGGLRRRRALPWAVLALWVAAIALAGPFAGKLGDVQRDGAVDYLPASADSTQVGEDPGGAARR